MKGNSEKIDRRAIGQRIRRERERLGLSREELAEITGFSGYYIGQLERGERQMSLYALTEIASKLRVSLDYLVWGADKPLFSPSYVFENPNSYGKKSLTEWEEINSILTKCTAEELVLFKKILKVIIRHFKGTN